MIKEKCFAYDDEKKECKALNKLYCEKEKCSFFKTEEEFKKGMQKAEERK